MTRLMRIIVSHMLFVPLISGRVLLRFTAILGSFLVSSGPALPFLALASVFLNAGLVLRVEIKDLAVGGDQGLATPRSRPSFRSAIWSTDRWRKSSATCSVTRSASRRPLRTSNSRNAGLSLVYITTATQATLRLRAVSCGGTPSLTRILAPLRSWGKHSVALVPKRPGKRSSKMLTVGVRVSSQAPTWRHRLRWGSLTIVCVGIRFRS